MGDSGQRRGAGRTEGAAGAAVSAGRTSCDATNAFDLPAIAEANTRRLRLP